MSEQAYDAPKCPFQDMPEPPPKYEESRSDTGDEINKNRGAGLTAQDICNQQQAPVMLVHNGQVVRVGQGTTLLAGAVFGKRTMPYTCPSCMQTIMTQTKHKAGKLTYLLACLMCCFVSPLLAWIPCCVKSCRDVDHTCPACDAYIGTFKRM